MANAERIANALGGAKRTPEGFICKCPCHDDRSASLSLTVSDKGGIVLNCFAGCAWQDVKAEIERRGLLDRDVGRDVGRDASRDASKYPAKRKDRYEGAKFYYYYDLVGNALCRKVKMPDKKMWFERYEAGSYTAGLAGMVVPLYNLAAVAAADTVYLCEGEKDAETLITRGLVGTTNHAGAKSWAPHLTEQLKGKTVIVLPDNDEPGRKRVAIVAKALQGVVKELRVFVPDGVPDHGDITDWVEAGGDVAQIFARSVVSQKGAVSKKAGRDDYYALFEQVWNSPRRCMFSRKLMYWDSEEGLWNPCINALDVVRSEALVLNESRESKFVMSSFEPHFFAFEASKECELLVDIPEWDGKCRIEAMAALVKLKPSARVSQDSWAELLLEWCALVFERLENPKVQNRILILQGGQGIGKDTWTDMLVDGLGQFCIPLNVVGNDKDTFLSLHDGLVMKISEFDKTSKTEVSTLKDMITAPKTMLRGAYERDRRVRNCRCSFISSANVEDLLRDHTGSRRYMIVEIERIEYGYKGWTDEQVKEWQMQCLAEMRKLAELRYRASETAHREMREYLEGKTPSDPCADVIELFGSRLRKENIGLSGGEVRIHPNDERAVATITSISKDTGMKQRTIRNMLNSKLLVRARVGDMRPRLWVVPPVMEEVRDVGGESGESGEFGAGWQV